MSSDEEIAPEPVAWLRKEIGDDLTFAQACLMRPILGTDFEAVNERIARCEAELAILEAHDLTEHYCPLPVLRGRMGQLWTPEEGPCWTVRLLASGYRHRPGYREEDWRATLSDTR